MDVLVLGLFCLSLLLCLCCGLPVLYALTAGLVLFLLYGAGRGYRWRELLGMALSGVWAARNVLFTFLLIGVLTALWRQAGTIAAIVCYAAPAIRPSCFLPAAFLLNCLVSFLTGTAFGTAATMGVICATMAPAMGVSPVLLGGAILSGVFVGDRCSPVSTSALLVAEITKTNLYHNIKAMFRTALIPFLVTCLLYALLGQLGRETGVIPDLHAWFGREFSLHWFCLLPAGVILLLPLLKVKVKMAMLASILTALPLCLFLQDTGLEELPQLIWSGYRSTDGEIAAMLNGGGIVSMLRATAIVCLSSSYSGIFRKTGLLDRAKHWVSCLCARSSPCAALILVSLGTGLIACNQTLTILLSHQLCEHLEEDSGKLALWLEDTAVVLAALVPWSTAAAVPLGSTGSPAASIPLAFFLYLLPLWRLVTQRRIFSKNP